MKWSELDTAATHALHALPENEAASFEQGLSADLAGALASFRRVAAFLLDGIPEIDPSVSPNLWHRIAESAGINASTHPLQCRPGIAPGDTRMTAHRPGDRP
jgi:hypothetical protein